MCLEVTLTLSQLAKSGVSSDRLCDASGLLVERANNNLGTCLHISKTGPCSCDLLNRNAKHEKSWELDPQAAARVATALPLDMTWQRVIGVFLATLVMCLISGAVAVRRLRAAQPADVF